MENPFEAHPRIFIVDDEISIAKMMSVVLQMNLFDATPFADAEAVLAAARIAAPDYLITDIVMRGMTGIELAMIVRRDFPSCKIMLFSGQAEGPKLVSDAQEAGNSFTFLQKPIHPTDLVAAIRNL